MADRNPPDFAPTMRDAVGDDQPPVKAIDKWPSNADLIADCARLGYLRSEWRTLDPTYGYGTFWKTWQPDVLLGCDLDGSKSPIGGSIDFTHLPWPDRSFDAVVFDPPYKLNGTPSDTDGADERYGVHGDRHTRWQDRMDLCRRGIVECARVLGDGYLLLKCQDQVVSGKIRWQTIAFAETAEACGLGLVDRFDFLSYRPQPEGRRQVTARRCSSQLLVFKRGWSWRDRDERPEPDRPPTGAHRDLSSEHSQPRRLPRDSPTPSKVGLHALSEAGERA